MDYADNANRLCGYCQIEAIFTQRHHATMMLGDLMMPR
jgi:hypothetical protein